MHSHTNLSELPLELGDGLRLRWARPDDIDALIEFNTQAFDERVTYWTRDLLSGQHPTVQAGDFTVVEDTRSNKIVSSMCLISQTWTYAGIAFPVGRPELIATHPDVRRRGLVRKQFEIIHARSAAKGELMQVITGLDWFYRQFGYEMGVKLWGSRCLDAAHLPKLKEGETERYRLRPATNSDHGFIRSVYEHAMRTQLFAASRSLEEWDYEFKGRSRANTRRREWLIVESIEGDPLGYVQYLPCLPWAHWTMLRIYQIELKSGVGYLNLMPGLLRGLWAIAQAMVARGELPQNQISGLELTLERDHPLFRTLPKDLVRALKPSPWYIGVPDMVAFLRRIRPALESHLVGTAAEGYSGELKLNFFRRGLRLQFDRGRIAAIEDWLPDEVWQGDVRFPELTFLHLLCGWRRFHEVAENFADCWGTHEAAVLLDCLFPAYNGKVWVLS